MKLILGLLLLGHFSVLHMEKGRLQWKEQKRVTEMLLDRVVLDFPKKSSNFVSQNDSWVVLNPSSDSVTLFSYFSYWSLSKGPWDGIGGFIKTHAYNHAKKFEFDNPIRDSVGLYEHTQKYFKKITAFHVSQEEIDLIALEKNLDDRELHARAVDGTRDYHQYESIQDDPQLINARLYSTSENVDTHKIYKNVRKNTAVKAVAKAVAKKFRKKKK